MRDEPVAWLLTGGFYGGEIGDYDIEHNDAECERLNVAANGTEVRVPLFASRWQPIATAPQDGTEIVVWCDGVQELPPLVTRCAWHQDAGFCVDELREPKYWIAPPNYGYTDDPQSKSSR